MRVPSTGNYFEFVYADHATFGKAPIATLDSLAEADLAVFGVPWDATATLRAGARLGPRRIREHTMWFHQVWSPAETPMAGFDPIGERVRDHISIVDCGDATVFPTDVAKTADSVRSVARTTAGNSFPLMLGGDHYVMFPSYQGVCDAHPDAVVGIVQIDAHNDLIDEDPVLGRDWSGTPIRRAMDHSSLDPRAVAQLGLRGFIGENERADQRDAGFSVFGMDEIRSIGAAEAAKRAVAAVLDHCDLIYVTVDIDGVDPSAAPGCCTPVPGGLLGHEFLALLRELGCHPEVAALDLVEVAPPLDPTDQTPLLAAHGLFGFIEQRFLRAPGAASATTAAKKTTP